MSEVNMAIPVDGEHRPDGVVMWFVSFFQPDTRGKPFGAAGFKAPCLLRRTDTATETIRHNPPLEAEVVCPRIGEATVRVKETA